MSPPSPADLAVPAQAGVFRRHRGKLMAIAVLVVVVALAALYTAATLAFAYSRGERVGYVQKLSRKGWVCRTWEGELAMNPVPGSTPQLFPFSVRKEEVAARLRESEGKKVAISYEEKKGVPTSCFGETSYFVTAVRVVSP
jgi:hypothetical protein